MTTAVDTSVLLDLLLDDPQFAERSERALRRSSARGRLIVGETVVAELMPTLKSEAELLKFLADLNLEFVPSTQRSAARAGETYQEYLTNKGTAKRVLPDFLVAAHAEAHADGLLARDRGYYRSYFDSLNVVDPTDSSSVTADVRSAR